MQNFVFEVTGVTYFKKSNTCVVRGLLDQPVEYDSEKSKGFFLPQAVINLDGESYDFYTIGQKFPVAVVGTDYQKNKICIATGDDMGILK